MSDTFCDSRFAIEGQTRTCVRPTDHLADGYIHYDGSRFKWGHEELRALEEARP